MFCSVFYLACSHNNSYHPKNLHLNQTSFDLRTSAMMGVSCGDDDVVQIQQPNKPGDPFIVTVNCPDKTGLACDICRIILDFGLCITKGGLTLTLFQHNTKHFLQSIALCCCSLCLMEPLFRRFNRWCVVLHCVVGYSSLLVDSYELFLSQRTSSGDLSTLFGIVLSCSATF